MTSIEDRVRDTIREWADSIEVDTPDAPEVVRVPYVGARTRSEHVGRRAVVAAAVAVVLIMVGAMALRTEEATDEPVTVTDAPTTSSPPEANGPPEVDIADAGVAPPERTLLIPLSDDESGLGGTFIDDAFPMAPSGFVVMPDGRLAIVDWMKARVALYSSDGAFLSEMPGLDAPTDIAALDGSRALLVSLGGSGGAFVASEEGQAPEVLDGIGGMAVRTVSSGGRAWVEISPGLWQQVTADGPGRSLPGGLPVGGDDGTFLVTSQVGTEGRLALEGPEVGQVTVVDLDDMSLGTPLLAERTSDGGLVVAVGVWNTDASWILVVVLDADGDVVRALRLPEGAVDLVSGSSGVRWDPTTEQVVVATELSPLGMELAWFATR